MARIIQVDYDALQTGAVEFRRQADQVLCLTAFIRQGIDGLESGGWQGIAAQAFFTEMECDIMPALDRLSAALEASKNYTLLMQERFRAGEEQAARYFMGESWETLPGSGETLTGTIIPDWLPGVIKNAGRAWDVTQLVVILSHMRAGTAYADEIVLSGSQMIKTVIMGMDSGYVSHIRADHLVDDVTGFSSRLRGVGVGLAAIGLAVDWVQDVQEYGSRGLDYVATAMAVDTAQTAVSWAAAAKGATIGATIGSAVGPVGTVVGGLVGGIITGLAVDYLWDTPLTTVGSGAQATEVSFEDMATEWLVTSGRAVGDALNDATTTIMQPPALQLDQTLSPSLTL